MRWSARRTLHGGRPRATVGNATTMREHSRAVCLVLAILDDVDDEMKLKLMEMWLVDDGCDRWLVGRKIV